MKKWPLTPLRIAGLVLAAILAGSLLLWYLLTPDVPPAAPEPAPAREVFHASKAIQLQVTARPGADGKGAPTAWLEHELRHLLNRGKMRVAAAGSATRDAFTLRVEISADSKHAVLALVAPDDGVERKQRVPLLDESRLAMLGSLATQLPRFLDAAHSSADWIGLIGTEDAKAYDTYLNSALDLFGPQGHGFTSPAATLQRARTIERLESLTRNQPQFARAWAALAAGYLSLGGEDETSLTQLAGSSAARALSLDDQIAEAHAVLGLVHLRRGQWIAAREQFDVALALDVNSVPALEGAGCLLVDAGQFVTARSFVEQALALQPGNVGALECLAYIDTGAESSAQTTAREGEGKSAAAARVQALAALLAGDRDAAQQLLRDSLSRRDFRQWADPLLRAAANRRRVPDALQAITRAASEEHIDASTEILCGAALRQTEFVFNRIARLQRQREPVPLRVLWIPQTSFLREHARFEEIVSAAGLAAFWQEYGVPDTCATEPAVYGCKVAAVSARSLP